jgi:hypothetical protein
MPLPLSKPWIEISRAANQMFGSVEHGSGIAAGTPMVMGVGMVPGEALVGMPGRTVASP